MRCRLCGREEAPPGYIFCDLCAFALFQLYEIIQFYEGEEEPPEWLKDALREFDFIYNRSPRTRAFFNVAKEIIDMALIEGRIEFYWSELLEPSYTVIDPEDLQRVLERSGLIDRVGEKFRVGPLVRKLRLYRSLGFSLSSDEMDNLRREIYGLISVVITYALITDEKMTRKYLPRSALAIFRALSAHAQRYWRHPQIPEKVFNRDWRLGFKIIGRRQARHMMYDMLGLFDGRTRILMDIDENGDIVLKPSVKIYLERVRERYRERFRERAT